MSGMLILIVALVIQSGRLVDAQFEIKELHAQLNRIKQCMESKGGAQ
jgi:hypothetical protein